MIGPETSPSIKPSSLPKFKHIFDNLSKKSEKEIKRIKFKKFKYSEYVDKEEEKKEN